MSILKISPNYKYIFVSGLLSISLLAGCAKKPEDSSAEANTETSEKAESAEAAADAVNDNQPDTTPSTTQKPDVILNAEANSAEAARRMVREANVAFTAKDVVKTTLAIEKLTIDAGGFIEQKNIDFHVADTQTQKIADGKIKIFEKVDPLASLIIRVPSERAAGVVNQLLPLMFFLNQQQYSAKRYELKLLEEKIAQTQTVPSDTRRAQQTEIARLTQMEVQDRVRYSTIQIQVNQPSTVRERIDIDMDAVARLNGDSFWKRAWNGIQYGWQFVLDLLVVLITIWPLYLIMIVGVLIYRVAKPWINKLK